MLRISSDGRTWLIIAGEAMLFEIQLLDQYSQARDIPDNSLVLSLYEGGNRAIVEQELGTRRADSTGEYFYWPYTGTFTNGLFGKQLKVEVAQIFNESRVVLWTADLTVASSAATVPSLVTAPIGVVITRLSLKASAQLGASPSVSIALRPFELPAAAPVFEEAPEIQHDGTPTAGEQAALAWGTITGGSWSVREVLLNGSPLSGPIGGTITLQAGTYQLHEEAEGPGGEAEAFSEEVVVQAATPTLFPAYKPAVAASRAGSTRTLILMAGDSTTAGEWGGNPAAAGLTNGAHRSAVPAKLSALFIASGLPDVGREAFGFPNNALNAAGFKGYNPDAVLAGNWQNQSSASSLGGNLIATGDPGNGNGDTLGLYDPAGVYDRLEVFYPKLDPGSFAANGSENLEVAFNDVVVGNFNQHVGPTGVGSSVFTGTPPPSGTQAGITIANRDGGRQGYLIGAIASRSASKGVMALNVGVSGQTTADFVNTSQPWHTLKALALVPARLATFCFGINDWQNGISLDAYAANLGTMVDAANAAGMDAMLIAPNRTDTAITAQATQDSYAARMQQVATAKGVAFLDIATLPNMATYAQANAAGLMGDGRHPNAAGYAVIAAGIYAVLGNPA